MCSGMRRISVDHSETSAGETKNNEIDYQQVLNIAMKEA